jgi:hypothetical protein
MHNWNSSPFWLYWHSCGFLLCHSAQGITHDDSVHWHRPTGLSFINRNRNEISCCYNYTLIIMPVLWHHGGHEKTQYRHCRCPCRLLVTIVYIYYIFTLYYTVTYCSHCPTTAVSNEHLRAFNIWIIAAGTILDRISVWSSTATDAILVH